MHARFFRKKFFPPLSNTPFLELFLLGKLKQFQGGGLSIKANY
jgi:hypothetical protein